MFRTAAAVCALIVAAPVFAQPPAGAPAGPTPEQMADMPPEAQAIARAGMALGACIQGQVAAAGPNADVDATAAIAVAGCAAQKSALETAVEALIASPIVPEAEKATARAGFREEMTNLTGEVAARIRAGRAAATQPPVTTPAPAPGN